MEDAEYTESSTDGRAQKAKRRGAQRADWERDERRELSAESHAEKAERTKPRADGQAQRVKRRELQRVA